MYIHYNQKVPVVDGGSGEHKVGIAGGGTDHRHYRQQTLPHLVPPKPTH